MFSFSLNGFGLAQIIMTTIIFTFSFILYLQQNNTGKKVSAFTLIAFVLTYLSTVGIFASGTLYTLFVCFEVMSFASFALIIDNSNAQKIYTSKLYLATSVITGMIMLMGIFILENTLGTGEIEKISTMATYSDKTLLYVGGALTLVGFCTKAAMYPLHFWLPKTYFYTASPITAIFSSVLSKAGLFGVIFVSAKIFYVDSNWGEVLIIFALITMVWGGLCALKSDDMKKTIAFSSMSQIGFVLFGIAMNSILGEYNSIAVSGIVLHMLNHAAFKMILFTLCGVAVIKYKSTNLNKLRGIARKNKSFAIFTIISAAGLMGVPGLSGYVSKTLLHESVVEYIHLTHSTLFTVYEYVFLFAGGLTVCYMLKIISYLFAKPKDSTKIKLPLVANIAMGICALYAIGGGILPNLILEPIANYSASFFGSHEMHAVNYFSLVNLRGALISIIIGITLYVIFTKSFLHKIISKIHMPKPFKFENIYYFTVYILLANVLKAVFLVISRVPEVIVQELSNIFFKPAKEKNAMGHVLFSYKFGESIDATLEMFGIKPKQKFAELLSDFEQQSSMRRRMISASLSFGLLFAGIGLMGVLIYMFITFI